MNTNTLLSSLVGTLAAALACCQALHAQDAPDIVWQTNASTAPVTSIALSPDGSLLASAEESDGLVGRVRLWRVDTGGLVRTLTRSHEDFLAVAFSPDGTLLATGGGGSERDEGKLRIWRMADGSLALVVGGARNIYVSAVQFSADGTIIGWGDQSGFFRLKRLSDGALVGSLEEPVHGTVTSLAFSSGTFTLISGGTDGTAKHWDYTNGVSMDTLLRTFAEHQGAVNALGFLFGETDLATGSSDSKVIVRRISDGLLRPVIQDAAPIVSLALSADSQALLTAGVDIKFWRIADGKLLQTYTQQTQGVTSLAATKDGKYFAYSRSDGAIVLAHMPLWISDVTRNGNEITLHWRGGSGRYQLQGRSSLSSGQWQNLGNPTTNTIVTHACFAPMFYRVQSL